MVTAEHNKEKKRVGGGGGTKAQQKTSQRTLEKSLARASVVNSWDF